MYCPKCGTENLDDTHACRACGAQLSIAPVPSGSIVPRRSQLASAALVLGILSLFTCGLTAIPAVVLGIVGFILIEKSGGRLTGRDYAIWGVVIPVLAICVVLLFAALVHVKQIAYRMVCGTNLTYIGMAMLIYSNDYDDQLPRSGGKDTPWAMQIPDWKANNRSDAYGLGSDGSGGQGSISSCFYLLVKYAKEGPKSFVCKGDAGVSVFNPADEGEGGREVTDFWDFGSEPTKHCSYSYHQPFSSFPLTTSSDPGMAVASDRNPWIESPASEGKKARFAMFLPTGGRDIIKIGNAIQHQEDGQNVLFLDCHVNFEKNPFCGVNDDNIYTSWDGTDIRKAALPAIPISQPMDAQDSFLVHDGRSQISGRGR